MRSSYLHTARVGRVFVERPATDNGTRLMLVMAPLTVSESHLSENRLQTLPHTPALVVVGFSMQWVIFFIV